MAVVVAAVALSASATTAQAQSNLARCRLEAGRGELALARTYIARRAQCMRFTNYQCDTGYLDGDTPFLATSACDDAYFTDDVPLEEIFPSGTPACWTYPTSAASSREIVTVALRRNRGLDQKLFYDLDLPDEAPASAYERQCIRAAFTAMTKAIVAGLGDQIACAGRSGEPPWNCPIDTSDETKLGKAFGAMSRRLAKCRDSSGTRGAVSGGAANLCNRAVTTPEDLAACMRQAALCQICVHAITTLGTANDCAAVSGDPDCNPEYDRAFGKPPAGALAVANEGDDSVTFFADAGSYASTDLAGSTIGVGASPVDVAVAERANGFVSVNRDDNSVTLLHAYDGTYRFGTLAASTVAVGAQPSAAIVNPDSDFLYVANRGDGTVTFLDAFDGSYAYGTLAASTFASGAAPSALALSTDGSVLYVANAGDGTVTFLDARSGAPLFGTLALSTFLVGDGPTGLAVYAATGGDRLAVINENDDNVYLLDAATGAPADGTPSASTRNVPSVPTAIAAYEFDGPTLFVATAGDPGVTVLREGEPWLTNDGSVSSGSVALTEPAGDLAIADATPYRYGAPAQLVVSSTATDSIFRMPMLTAYGLAGPADAERSLIPLPPTPLFVAANEATPGYFVAYVLQGGYDPLLFVDENGEVQWDVPIPNYPSGLAYSAATDTVFVGSYTGVVFVDGSDGSYKFGTAEASTFSCGCDREPRFVDDSTGTLYVTCDTSIAFMDTADGSCTTAAINVGGTLEDVVLDRANGILYAAMTYVTGSIRHHVILRYDATTGAYFDGTYDDSVVRTWTHTNDYYSLDAVRLAISPDGATLYEFDHFPRELAAIDTATFSVGASIDMATLGAGFPKMIFGGASDGDPVLLFRGATVTEASRPDNYSQLKPAYDDIVYLSADTLAPVGGDVASSRILLGESDSPYPDVPTFAYNAATGSVAAIQVEPNSSPPRLDVGPGLVLVAPDAPQFSWSLSAREAGPSLASGDQPGAIAVMPAHSQLPLW